MQAFRYDTQTCIYFGRNALKDNMEKLMDFGKKAVVVTTIFPEGCKNLALEDVKDVLRKLEVEFKVLDNVEENPPVENIVDMYEKLNGFTPDYVFGVGGGSAMDAAKALAQYINDGAKDPYHLFFWPGKLLNNYKNMCDIPVFTVPTTAGTGSEVTGGAVLTRADKDTKESMNMWLYPEISFVDPRYLETSPLFLLDTGAIDALAHGVEGCLHKDANVMNRGVSFAAFQLFGEFKDALLKNEMTEELFDKMSAHSLMQGVSFMQSCTTIPHGLGYPLSHKKGVCHGLACGIFLGEYLKAFKDQSLVQPIVDACGFKNTTEFADYVRQLTNRDVEIEVTEEELQSWTDQFMVQQAWRLEANPEELDRDDIYNLYKVSLEAYIK